MLANLPLFDHSKSRLVWISDPHCIKQAKTTESKLVKRVYLVKEESTEEGESLQGVEAVKKEGELDNQEGVRQVLTKNPRDQFSNPGLKKRARCKILAKVRKLLKRINGLLPV